MLYAIALLLGTLRGKERWRGGVMCDDRLVPQAISQRGLDHLGVLPHLNVFHFKPRYDYGTCLSRHKCESLEVATDLNHHVKGHLGQLDRPLQVHHLQFHVYHRRLLCYLVWAM